MRQPACIMMPTQPLVSFGCSLGGMPFTVTTPSRPDDFPWLFVSLCHRTAPSRGLEPVSAPRSDIHSNPVVCHVCTLSRKGAPKLQSIALVVTTFPKLLMKGTQSSMRNQWVIGQDLYMYDRQDHTHRHRRIALFRIFLTIWCFSFGCLFFYEFQRVHSAMRSLHYDLRHALEQHHRHSMCNFACVSTQGHRSLRTVTSAAMGLNNSAVAAYKVEQMRDGVTLVLWCFGASGVFSVTFLTALLLLAIAT
ncbi:hypothetical protein EDB81DRAFT_786075 [Dactylonectria macrodidyma]|uniref:Transmembrane protein n=1 Tax=Dactylonectria macrodidyma TaxID=307937 RepID=A0A9P9F9Y4_9HYPO|nr:hypothetical protein EDB81DRAFT_786075 [Dactylonectria macrodidyma]